MDSSTSSLVVKVSYGGVLRRFRVPVKANGELDLDISGLKEKISALFNFPLNAEFSLTYSDEDGDLVALVDNNDLFDVTNQRLQFLKINVELNNGLSTNSIASESSESESSTAKSMPKSENTVSKFQKGINDVLMAVPNPMRDTISKVYMDLATKAKASSSSPVVGEMLDCISKLGKLASPQEKGVFERTQTERKPATLNQPASFVDPKDFSHVPSFNECPFSGSTMNDSRPNPINFNKHGRRGWHSKKSSDGDYWNSVGIFHKGIRCDGCGVLPITGPRFKSKVKEDYDLCTICFTVMGNEKDYTRMDKPITTVQHMRQLPQFPKPWLGHSMPRPPHGGVHFRCTRPKLDSRFVLDVNVLDGTVVAPTEPFTKIWKMRNNGSLVWPRGTQIVWIGGDRFSNSLSVDLQIPEEGVPINSEIDVKVEFIAPESPGRYISYWRMASSNGAKFGQRVWVLINVDASLKESIVNEFHGLNLNASPVNHESAQQANPSSSSSSSNTIESPNKLTTDEDLCVGGNGSSSPVPLQEDIEKNDVEINMLKELEEMGFKEIDLNKEILRDNEYNLEKSIVALCRVSEWDPILEELQEMGFVDDVTNKKLLKKNNGSIKGVVMDLLTGEKKA